jgi:hypothetical protein
MKDTIIISSACCYMFLYKMLEHLGNRELKLNSKNCVERILVIKMHE